MTWERDPRVSGRWGWLGLAIYVIWWDSRRWAQTLSDAFSPPGTHGKRLALVLWAVTTLHLIRLLPHKMDPFCRVADAYVNHKNRR